MLVNRKNVYGAKRPGKEPIYANPLRDVQRLPPRTLCRRCQAELYHEAVCPACGQAHKIIPDWEAREEYHDNI